MTKLSIRRQEEIQMVSTCFAHASTKLTTKFDVLTHVDNHLIYGHYYTSIFALCGFFLNSCSIQALTFTYES